MLYPVWGQIAQLTNGALRVALYTAHAQELAALQRAFPACFSENQADIRVPASMLKEGAQRLLVGDGGNPSPEDPCVLLWMEAAHGLDVPVAFRWSGDAQVDGADPRFTRVPSDVWEQLKGKSLDKPQVVLYLGERFIVVGGYAAFGTPEDEDTFSGESRIFSMEAIHERFIDLHA